MNLGDNKEYAEGFSYAYLTLIEELNKVCKKKHIEIAKIKIIPIAHDISIQYNMGYNYAIRIVLDQINNLFNTINAGYKIKVVDED